MGTCQTHYVILGIRVPFAEREDLERFHDNGYQSEIKGPLSLVVDGMNGKYMIMGEILAKGLEHEGLPVTEYKHDESKAEKIGEQVCSLLGIESRAASLHVFTHWH